MSTIDVEKLKKSFELLNPENREKFGYVELTNYKGTKIDIVDLKLKDKVFISNTKRKIEVEVLN